VYYVEEHKFDELLDAIAFCKTRPTATLTDHKGTILMKHVQLSYEEFRDIQLAKAILDIQTGD